MRVVFKESGEWRLMPHALERDIAACVVSAERRGGRDALVVRDEWQGACVCCGDPVETVKAALLTEEVLGEWLARVLRVYAGNQRNVAGN